jgi:CheY-like chemotaxis protein
MNERGEVVETRSGDEVERLSALGQIAGELIHDLANVVAVVHGRASLALGDARAGRPAAGELERLVEASEDLGVMLRDVLEILRGARLSPEVRFDPIKVVERVVRRFLDSAPPLEVRLISGLPKGLMVPGRGSFLARAILNLLNNASRYARSEVRMTLSLEDGESPVMIMLVEDDGPGISPEIASGIFQPLFRGDGGGAAGLGLSSVSWAVTQLGGSIRFCGEASLGGAAFEVRVPAAVPRKAPPAAPVESVVGRRIALLEEDAAVQHALSRLLVRMGAEVTEIEAREMGEEEVLQAILRGMPDVILLDVRLAGRQGRNLWRSLRDQVGTLAERVVFLTTLGPGDPQWEAARATGQPVISKPLDVAALAHAVATVMKPR